MFKSVEAYKQYHAERYKMKQKILEDLKSVPCADCGGTFPHYVMEFDHVPERGPKKYNITNGANHRRDWQEEVAKCDVVCANCHKARTWHRQQAGLVQR